MNNKKAARIPAIKMLMLPRDTNPLGSIFGGHILSLIDLAAAQHAHSVIPHQFVTRAVKEVNFLSPVRVGDTVSFYTETVKIGHTSMTVKVDVEACRGHPGAPPIHVTSAEVVVVAIDAQHRPVAISVP